VVATSDRHILIYSHRGACGLAPENTIPAYRISLGIGVDYVDIDVVVTKDSTAVAAHDLFLNSNFTRNNEGKWINDKKILIKDLTWKELQTYDVGKLKPRTRYAAFFPEQKAISGTGVPRLQEIIKLVKQVAGNKVSFQVEIKTNPYRPEMAFTPEYIAKVVVKVLQEERVDTYTELQAFDWRVLQAVQKLDEKVATAYLTNQNLTKKMYNQDPKIAGLWSAGFLVKDYDNSIPKMIAKLGGKIWGPEHKELNRKTIAEAHIYGLKVVPWTVNTKEKMKHMIDLLVDGIVTDRPDILREILATKGYKLPPKF